MRKRITAPTAAPPTPSDDDAHWLSLDELAEVEVTSEADDAPIEEALLPGGSGWRAGSPGAQTITLRFDAPQRIRRVRIHIAEERTSRLQEFLLSWAGEDSRPREIVRQQYHFSPGTSRQIEDYRVELEGVKTLELKITPDLSGGSAVASLAELRVSA